MAYIYKKNIAGKFYYYLRISKRVNGKLVVKDVAYLGNNVDQLWKKLDKLPKYQKEIRKGHRGIKKFIESNYYLEKVKGQKLKKDDYLSRDLLEQLEAIKLHYRQHFLKLDEQTKKETYEHFLIDFAFNTTSIEGNTITLNEARKLLQDEILPKNRTLREVYDLQNTETVFFSLLSKNPAINEGLIKKIHDKLLENIDIRKGYRTSEIRVFQSRFESSPVKYIHADMKLLLDLLKRNYRLLYPLVLVGIIHHKLEKIHPFADGNGRTGRMLMNHILMRNRYPPLIIAKKWRRKYLEVLREADYADLKNIESTYYKNLVSYLAEEMITSYWENFNV